MARGLALGTLVVLLVLAAGVLLARVLGLDAGYPLVAVMTVLPWVVVLCALLLAAAGLLGERRVALAAAVLLAVGVVVLAPRAVAGPGPAVLPDGPELVVAVANLREGAADAGALVAVVEDHAVDVLLTLELTELAIGRLADAGLGAVLPEQVLLPSRLTSGGGIHARTALEALEPGTSRRFGSTPRARLSVDGAPPVVLEGVHPLPPIDREWTAQWQAALAGLPLPGRADEPVVLVAGDLNATLDHRALRAVLARGWVDAADAVGAGLRPTFNALPFGEPVPPVTIDHVLVDGRVQVLEVATAALPDSDHHVLVVRLRLPAG